MPTSSAAPSAPDVPAQVFTEFLQALEAAGVSPALAARLHKALLADKAFTDRALGAAIFPEEPAP